MCTNNQIGIRRRTRSAAFTLVEVLVAMLVAGITAVTIYAGMAQGFKSLQSGRYRLRATQILTEKLEVIRLYNWDQVNAPGFIPTTFTEYFTPGTNVNNGILYTGTLTITEAPVTGAYTNTMRKAVAHLKWVSGGIPQEQSMETLISEYGVQNYVY